MHLPSSEEILLTLLLTGSLMLVNLSHAVLARSAGVAEGIPVDARALRLENDVRRFQSRAMDVRRNVESAYRALASSTDEWERQRRGRMLARFTVAYFDSLASVYRAYGQYVNYVAGKYENAYAASQASLIDGAKRAEEVKRQRERLETQRSRLAELASLLTEARTVLGESIGAPSDYEQLLHKIDHTDATIAASLNDLSRVQEAGRERNAMLTSRVHVLRLTAEVAHALEATYAAAAAAGRRVIEAASVTLPHSHVLGLPEVSLPPEMQGSLYLPDQ